MFVESIRQLDQEHADVAGHRDDHLPHVLGLGQLAGAERELVQPS